MVTGSKLAIAVKAGLWEEVTPLSGRHLKDEYAPVRQETREMKNQEQNTKIMRQEGAWPATRQSGSVQ